MPNWCVQQLEYAAAAAGCSGVGCVIQEYFTYFTELGRWNKNYFVFWRTICCACCILPTIGELVVQFMGKRFSHVGKETGNKEPHAFMEPWALIRCSWTWTHTWVLLFQRMGAKKTQSNENDEHGLKSSQVRFPRFQSHQNLVTFSGQSRLVLPGPVQWSGSLHVPSCSCHSAPKVPQVTPMTWKIFQNPTYSSR
jgi:hypothetical protein